MELDEILFSPESQQQKYFCILSKQQKHKQTPLNAAMLKTLIYIPVYPLLLPRLECWCRDSQGKKEQCSLASRMTEWHFYDVSQIIP